ncbi:MAG TPA: single-stranded DNA-binding protein [Candidatus Kapabacteria bacterium]|nr:single-stranded DNA-binding protein [Candidatus Kapabacteria bacterium]
MANKRSINRVILVGNVGKEPEVTHIPNLDKDVAKFSLATTEVFMDKKTNQFQDMTEWHNVVAWGWAAKKVERDIHKGSLVLVEGKIRTRKWKDKNDQDRWTTEIAAETVVSLDKTAPRESSYPGGRDAREGFGGYGGGGTGPMNNRGPGPNDYSFPETQAPPEMQIDDIPYDEDTDPF